MFHAGSPLSGASRPGCPPEAPVAPPALRLAWSTHAADVELHDAFVVKQLLCRTVQPVAPEHEDVAPVRMAKSPPGVLLDSADPDASCGDLLNLLPERSLEQGGQPGARLIEQHHGGLEHERPGHGEHAALTSTEHPGPAAHGRA